MRFFAFKHNLYPIIALLSSVGILVYGLIMAKSQMCSVFLLFALVFLCFFGCFRAVLRTLPLLIIFGGLFALIAYFAYGKDASAALAMANRMGGVFVAVVPGMSVEAVRMTRNLSQLRMPRGLTLGMLIAMSFVPVLGSEIRRVREAMKTRGAGSVLNPKIFYRAFLIPLVSRLVDISDTLSLSVETRGFTLSKAKYTVYKREVICVSDLIYIFGLVAVMVVLAVV